MDFLGLFKVLGPAGLTLFLVMVVVNAGLTQVVKAMYRKWQLRKGVPCDETLSSFGVALISVVIGALLGSVMLGGVAVRMEVNLPPAFAGALLGLLLGLMTWGLVGLIFQLRTKDGAEDAQRLLTLVRQVAAPGLVVAGPVPVVPSTSPVPPGPEAGAAPVRAGEQYADATGDDLGRMTDDSWPATMATEDPNWRP